ncbi:RNA-directed DNA polymerase, eukaryota, reverse transcriptase zinc-binding domain protein, partial [Tanacetum coccineum]
MRDPDPKNPNSVPPPRGTDDEIKPKRATRGVNSKIKLAPKYTFSISKPALGSDRKINKKGSKSRVLKKIVEDMEYDDVSDGSNVREEDEMVGDEFGDTVGSNSGMGRSQIEDVVDFRNSNEVDEVGDGGFVKDNEVCNVFQGNVAKNIKKLEKLANKNNDIGDIHVPFAENAILNPGFKDKGIRDVGNNACDTNMLDSASVRKPMSFVSTMQGMATSGSNKLSKIPVRVNEKGNNVVDMDPLLEEGSKKWDLTLVGYFVGLKMSYAEISGHLRRMWRAHQLAEIITNECGLYFLKFRSVEGKNYVLENGPWLFEGKPLFVQKSEAGLCMEKPEPSKVPIWVKIMNVPLEAWNSHGISRLASSLGNPIIMDRITTSMCERAYGRASFARVLVEIDATKELAENIEVCYSSLGKSMNLRVEYAWRPPLCTHCKVFGHDLGTCKVRDRTQEEKRLMEDERKKSVISNAEQNVKVNGGWQEVRRPIRNVASTSKNVGQQNDNRNSLGNRGGYIGRGRGGMFGRGGLSGGRGGMFHKENYEGVGKKFVPVRNVGQRVDNVHVMEGESSGSRVDKSIDVSLDKNGSVKKTSVKEGVNIRNSFEALVDDAVEIGGEEWVKMRSKIDLACELGMQIDDNEKKRWSEDLKKYYDDKCEANIKKNMISGLKWRIAKLQQDIVHINTYVTSVATEGAEKYELMKIKRLKLEQQKAEVDLFFYAEEVLTDAVRENWTDEMIQQYEGLMGEKVDKMMNDSFQGSALEKMDEEVAEVTSGTAEFMVRDEVSNVVEGNDAEGLGNSLKQNEVKNLINNNGIKMCGILETQLRKKFVNKICNEVFGDWVWVSNSVESKKGCRIAVGWDPAIVTPVLLSQTSQIMHFLVRSNFDNNVIYVSFVYGEVKVVGRRELWDNIRDHNNVVGDFPWVLLGDFNVILNFNENSRGIRINNVGVNDFRECVEVVNIEDIKVTGLFFTWVQKRKDPSSGILKKLDRIMGNGKFVDEYSNCYANFLPYGVSDHSPAVLVFPNIKGRKNRAFRFLNYLTDKKEFIDTVRDNWNIRVKGYDMFILAKRLKSLKKHMRDLNKKNGDVCEKVRKLKVELDRVQEALSRDPSSAYLREEELVYSESYRRAVSDEELLMKQKSKIQWLKEGDFNSAFFHNMVKGRVIKNRIESVYDDYGNVFYNNDMTAKFVEHFQNFFGKCDKVYPIEDHGNLFTKKIDPVTAMELIKPVSDEEIKMALFDIDDNKASGPDGYTSKFFKSAWSVVGKDTCAAVKEFFTSGKLLGELNTSIISLIPKVAVPKKVNDYRPISCCNVVYKTISKVITNRLKRVLNGLVGENQSAFIPGRQISDNILLTQEFMRGYNWNVWHGSSRCSFKIDIQKAYDTVSWKFLESILKNFGFHPIMINWIMEEEGLDEFCLIMPFKEGVLPIKYLGVPMVSKMITHRDCMVVIEVIRKRGLVDGVLRIVFVDEVDWGLDLAGGSVGGEVVDKRPRVWIMRQVISEKKFKYHWGCKELKITSLCFADDLLLLCHGDLISASVLRRGLDEFCLSSGLFPSMAKSEAFFGNVSESVKYDISLVMPFKEGVLPIKYLGVPMVSKMITHRDCMVVIEVIRKRVGDWRNKFLSFAGRLQLISSVLSSLQVYWSSLFLLPINTCNEIDRILKNFLWMGGGSNKGIVSVSWKDICKPKSQGGLGLRSAHLWNEALLAKHVWNVVSGKESLWVKWVNIYRLKGRSMWDVELHSGRGRLINHRVLEQAGMCLKNKVRDMIEGNEWVWPIEWDDRFEEVINVPVPVLDNDVNDKTIWMDKKGKEKLFSTKEVAIKGRLKTLDRISKWINVCSRERNIRWFVKKFRDVDCLYKIIEDTVRFKLLGLNLKNTPNVQEAASIWGLKISNANHYGRMMKDLMEDDTVFDCDDGRTRLEAIGFGLHAMCSPLLVIFDLASEDSCVSCWFAICWFRVVCFLAWNWVMVMVQWESGKQIDNVHIMDDNVDSSSGDKSKITNNAKSGNMKKVIEMDEIH